MGKPDTFDYKVVQAVGVQATAAVATSNTAIPNNAAGIKAKYVRLQSLTNYCYIRPGLSGVVATANDCLLSPNESLTLFVGENTHIAAIREGGADVKFNITPLEAG